MLAFAEVAYRGLLIEQDKRSAHRYVDSYEELKGKTLLDIGAAEAIFTLDTIEYMDHAYLFECDESWIEALEVTFAPYKEKITIVRKYVSVLMMRIISHWIHSFEMKENLLIIYF